MGGSSDAGVVWDVGADPGRTWVLRSRGPMIPLEVDLRHRYDAHAAACFELTGAPMVQFHESRLVHGHLYAASPPVDDEELNERRKRFAAIGDEYAARGTSLYAADLAPEIDGLLKGLRRSRPRRDRDLDALVRHVDRVMDVAAYVMGDLHWRMAAASGAGRIDWPTEYADVTGRPPAEAFVHLQAIDNRTTRLVARLRDLARVAQDDEAVGAAVAKRDLSLLGGEDPSPDVDAFRRKFDALLHTYGRRTGRGYGSASDFTTPTWSMRPEAVLDVIAAYVRQDLDELEALERAARAERSTATRRTRRALAGDPDRLARFDALLARVMQTVRDMENHNHQMEQETGGTLREAIDRVGRALVANRAVDDADDVFFLSLADLHSIAAGDVGGARGRVAERRSTYDAQSQLDAPPHLGPAPPAAPPPAGEELAEEGVLRGVAASRGRATGRARVAGRTADPPDLEPGDVLVAHDAGPAWTPVLSLAAAIVLDAGAPFQHAALVAREYRVPAVLGTRRATSVIAEGQIVTVDGDEGIVELKP